MPVSLKKRQSPNFVVFPRRKSSKKMTGQSAGLARHPEGRPPAISCSLYVLMGKKSFWIGFSS
jgi:hypothetical protein